MHKKQARTGLPNNQAGLHAKLANLSNRRKRCHFKGLRRQFDSTLRIPSRPGRVTSGVTGRLGSRIGIGQMATGLPSPEGERCFSFAASFPAATLYYGDPPSEFIVTQFAVYC